MMRIIPFILFILSISAYADHDLGGGVRVSDRQVDELKNSFQKLSEHKDLYHWTSFETASRWMIQGQLDRGEVDFYNRETGSRQVYGAGIYSAGNSTSSSHFGNTLLVFRVARGTPIYDAGKVQSILGKRLNNAQMTQLGRIIPFIRLADNYSDWYITHHPEVVSNIRFPENGIEAITISNPIELIDKLQKAAPHHGRAQHLESLIRLSYYMDGIAYYRALKVNPNNPWAEFEPNNFEKYRSAREHFENLALEGNNAQMQKISRGGRIGSGMDRENWVKTQIEEILPDMFRRISGTLGGIEKHIRTEGIRAGGNLDGETFRATDVELAELKSNKFIQVEHSAHPSGEGHLVAYHYPDAFHYEHLNGIISDDLLRELNRTDKDQIWRNTQLRNRLNQRIIRELLENIFRAHHNKSLGNNGSFNAQILKDLISIHPFKDFNGRTTRLYFDSIHLSSSLKPAYHFLSDFDLVRPLAEYNKILAEGTQAHEALVKAMVAEFLRAETENRSPRYNKLPELDGLFKALKPIGIDSSRIDFERFGRREFELIRRRRFIELFDHISGGASWRGGRCPVSNTPWIR